VNVFQLCRLVVALLSAPSLAETALAPEVNVGTTPVAVKLPVLSTLTEANGTPPIVTSTVTPAPLNPVPATLILVPTGPRAGVGDVMVTFGVTVKVAFRVFVPSVTETICAPAVVVGIVMPNVASPS
jgi:hypothetical protein